MVGRVAGSVPKSREARQAAVIDLCTRDESASVVAQRAGVSRPLLYNWKNQLLSREVPASMRRQKKPAPNLEIAELEQQIESLRRDIRKLELERDILKKANELVKKGMGIDPQLLSNREKTMLVDALKQTYPLPDLLSVLRLARSSYFYHRARLLVADRHAGARRVIADIFECNYRCYGYRRIRAALSRQQVFISEKVVRRLMRQEGLAAATTKRRRYGSYRGEISPAPENLINRDFRAVAPNQKWLTDITEFRIPAGKVYLSPVIDCFDGLVVSWAIGTRPDADSSMPCWIRPSRRWLIAVIGRWSTPIAVRTIVGRDGYPVCAMPGLFARCHAKDVHLITRPAKASSDGSKRNCSILATGGLRPLITSLKSSTRISAGTVRHVSPSAARQAACSRR
jgi:transposase-like protein